MSIADLTNEQFLQQFEDGTLDLALFHHEEHVRLGFICLERFGFWAGTDRIRTGINELATAAGHPDKYHETVTAAYMAIINERRHQQPENATWQEFITANSDLLEDGLLKKYYPESVLTSALAKDVFVLPQTAVARQPLAG